MYPLLLALGKVPSWLWMGIAALAIVALAHLSGRWVESSACHQRALDTANAVAAEVTKVVNDRLKLAAEDQKQRAEKEAANDVKQNKILEELAHEVLPDCSIPESTARLLNRAGGSD